MGVEQRGPTDVQEADTEPEAPGTRFGRARSDTTPIPDAGSSIGKFEIEGYLGQGGMGLVLAARDPALGRPVAIKLVRAEGESASEQAEHRARLLREARAMARLRHQNVLSVYEAGAHGDRVYVAMEHVDGGTLRDELRRRSEHGPVPWRDVVELFVEAGRGLTAAHSRGLVHRDFKPENVLVGRDGRILVADFGLVGTTAEHPAVEMGGDESLGEPLTRADVIFGTPTYMPPEQHFGRALDPRADQFAFCVSLYEALYGRLPFAGETRVEYVRAIQEGRVRRPPPGSRIPAWVFRVLARGMRGDPEDRYASMEELLHEFSTGKQGSAPGWRVRLVAALGLSSILALVAPLALYWGSPGSPLSYDQLLGLNALLGLAFGGVWLGIRRHVSWTWFNRRFFGLVALLVLANTALFAGGALAGIDPRHAEILHLFTCVCFGAAMSVTVAPRFAPATVFYLASFFAAAARPELVYAAVSAAHLVALVNLVAILRPGSGGTSAARRASRSDGETAREPGQSASFSGRRTPWT